MNSTLVIRLQTTPEQNVKLRDLQMAFAQVCNALAPLAQRTGCWNRVALHHQAYRPMRSQFPALGSQMICNAVYSVSRACRLIYQHPQSPFNLQRMAGKPLPILKFLPNSPVYFDRHTLSLRDGLASMYTLDGRMRFNLPLSDVDAQRFRQDKLREIVLFWRDDNYLLSFEFADSDTPVANNRRLDSPLTEQPEYLLVLDPTGDADSLAEASPLVGRWTASPASLGAAAPPRTETAP